MDKRTMFNSSSPRKGEPNYLFDISRYYKIWFSKNPDICLGTENELRLIRMREKNPSATLFLVYSQECLNPNAVTNLKQFCKLHTITPVAFEGIERLVVDPRDIALFRIANDEIRHALNDTGGNLAAAADCVRLIVPIIQKYGIYSDCDVHTEVSTLGAQFATLRGPMLFPADLIIVNAENLIPTPNTDFLAFSLNRDDPRHLSKDALFSLRQLQEAIIRNYDHPFTFGKISFGKTPTELREYPELAKLIAEFNRTFSDHPSIFNFRQFVMALPEAPRRENQCMSMKEFLLKLSVINFSGPDMYYNLFKHILPKKYDYMPVFLPFRSSTWQPFLQQYELCRTGFYTEIYDRIFSNNSSTKALEAKKISDYQIKHGFLRALRLL